MYSFQTVVGGRWRLKMRELLLVSIGIVIGATMAERGRAQSPSAPKMPPRSPAQKAPTKVLPEKSARELQFQRLDTSHDGKLDLEEFVGGSAGKAAEIKRQEF